MTSGPKHLISPKVNNRTSHIKSKDFLSSDQFDRENGTVNLNSTGNTKGSYHNR